MSGEIVDSKKIHSRKRCSRRKFGVNNCGKIDFSGILLIFGLSLGKLICGEATFGIKNAFGKMIEILTLAKLAVRFFQPIYFCLSVCLSLLSLSIS